jgi:ElaB/YqjD/DUF883 family membrane-anchored ribosome-binding protein
MKTQSRNASAESASNHAGEAPATKRATEAAHQTVDRLAGSAAKAEERIRGAVASSEEQLREKGAEVSASTEQAFDQGKKYTKENPLMAAGIAFATGLIVSRMIGR